MRIRYVSAHPKDFPKELLQVIKQHPNICKQVSVDGRRLITTSFSQMHLPAQSGNSEVLEAMGRGYTREAYLDLAEEIRATVPGEFFSLESSSKVLKACRSPATSSPASVARRRKRTRTLFL